MKNKIVVQVTSNVVIVVVLVTLCLVGFGGNALSVFNTDGVKPIYRGMTDKSNVTLMINVYWGTEYIEQMLSILSKYNVRTTFFVGGYWVMQNQELLCKIVEMGHEIGNHGYYHKDHDKLDYEQNVSEIVSNGKLVFETCGVNMKLFAPPSGAFNNNTLNACNNYGYNVIMWSRDTIDWRDKNSEVVFKRATENTSNGELILMHPTLHTLNALERIIKYYQSNGYNLVTVSENIGVTL